MEGGRGPQDKGFEGIMGSWLADKPQHRAVERGEEWAYPPKHFTFFEVFCVKIVAIESMRSESCAVALLLSSSWLTVTEKF